MKELGQRGMATRRIGWSSGGRPAGNVAAEHMFVTEQVRHGAGGGRMRVLGVDPGLTRCGLGVVEGGPGKPLRLNGTTVIRTPPSTDIASRLLVLDQQITRWLDQYAPDAVAVERVFSQHNVRTVMGTAQAGAVAIVCAARCGLPVAMHTPSEVKAAVTGSGRADKAQVTHMVTRLLRMPDPPRPADAADALALAICHLWRGGAQARIAAGAAAASGQARAAASAVIDAGGIG
jgi:crossover junction endodeoxyribonuclease RuvC